MTTKAEWLAIAERCEKATGPDREIDADILEAGGGCAHREQEYYCIEDGNDTDSGFTCKRCRKDMYGNKDVSPITASIDAITALTRREFPNARIHMVTGDNYSAAGLSVGWGAKTRWLSPLLERADDEICLTLCAALCKAMAEKAGEP